MAVMFWLVLIVAVSNTCLLVVHYRDYRGRREIRRLRVERLRDGLIERNRR